MTPTRCPAAKMAELVAWAGAASPARATTSDHPPTSVRPRVAAMPPDLVARPRATRRPRTQIQRPRPGPDTHPRRDHGVTRRADRGSVGHFMPLVVQMEQPRLHRLNVRMRGVLDASGGEALFSGLRDALAVVGEVTEVLLDLRWISDTDPDGHAALLKCQALIANCERRSAHLVMHPRTRALVLRICHELQDDGARPVSSEIMAEAWLSRPDLLGFADVSFTAAEHLLASVRAAEDKP